MCLILMAWQVSLEFPLILAANRDELHVRPTAAADWWEDAPQIYGGRDRQAGGSWLACHRDGRFAALTNYRDLRQPMRSRESRGALVRDFLVGEQPALIYAQQRALERTRWPAFNLLVGDRDSVVYLGSETGEVRPLGAGCYGLSNHLLDTPWPKVRRGRAALQAFVSGPARSARATQDALLDVLSDRRPAAVQDLPDTGLPLARERLVSAAMIIDPEYGTRCSSVLLRDARDGWHGIERSFSPLGLPAGERHLAPAD